MLTHPLPERVIGHDLDIEAMTLVVRGFIIPDLPLSCPRFLWTPYCPEKLEDDSVEGNGKTMIDAAGLVGSEGERGSSMLSITGQAGGGWSARARPALELGSL